MNTSMLLFLVVCVSIAVSSNSVMSAEEKFVDREVTKKKKKKLTKLYQNFF